MARANNTLRSNQPLSNDQIMRVAPSIFAEEAHESRSARYSVIPTIHVLNKLRAEGFEPFSVAQSRTRDEDKRGHAKHMLRLRHVSAMNSQVGEEFNEIVLTNSHDGSSSYQMCSGVYRLVCSNGLTVGTNNQEIRVRHSGDVVDNVIEGAFRVLEEFDVVKEQTASMKGITLDQDEREVFARAALQLRYEEDEKAPIVESQILRPRRTADQKLDLWTTFNTVQENMIKGGLRGRNASGATVRTRAITGLDQDKKLNRALWTLAEEMKKLTRKG